MTRRSGKVNCSNVMECLHEGWKPWRCRERVTIRSSNRILLLSQSISGCPPPFIHLEIDHVTPWISLDPFGTLCQYFFHGTFYHQDSSSLADRIASRSLSAGANLPQWQWSLRACFLSGVAKDLWELPFKLFHRKQTQTISNRYLSIYWLYWCKPADAACTWADWTCRGVVKERTCRHNHRGRKHVKIQSGCRHQEQNIYQIFLLICTISPSFFHNMLHIWEIGWIDGRLIHTPLRPSATWCHRSQNMTSLLNFGPGAMWLRITAAKGGTFTVWYEVDSIDSQNKLGIESPTCCNHAE